jgi:pyruvate dehydrogenase E2 component (dihydrolipoamide acetyltransferase)
MDVLMPQLGETVDEGTVAQWHKNVGDRIEIDEILLDVETDKTSMEIPSPAAGTVKSIRVEAGQTVAVGTVLAVIDSGDGAGDDADDGEGAGTDPSAGAGNAVTADKSADDPIHPPAASASTPPPDPGAPSAPYGGSRGTGTARSVTGSSHQRLSPAVRRLVAEQNLDIDRIAGSGRHGRITRRDVLEHIASGGHAGLADAGTDSRAPGGATSGPQASAGSGAVARVGAVPSTTGSGDLIPFNRIRRLTADHMVRSRATSPHVLQAVEVDFGAVQVVRNRMREAWRARYHFSLTWLPFIAHAVCRALAEFPQLNASVEDNALRLHRHINLAIAVDLGPADGLVAPVIHQAEQLSVEKLAHAIHELSQTARSGRLKPDQLSGGTYTLSNSGSFGTLITAPIINQPQVAILSSDGIRKRPVVLERADGDAIAIRPVGILAQSFDHRAVDGAYSAAFLAKVRSLIEQSNWNVEI